MPITFEKQIYDNVHGYIGLTSEELRIIDSPIFQRLRYIKQLGPAFLVYPGAVHTRFEHSLGTMFMMDMFLKDGVREEIDAEMVQKLRFVGLLHDIGHYPFSHTFESTIQERFGGKSHEKLGTEIIKRYLKDELENYNPEEITKLIVGKGSHEFGMLISSSLDADRADYMLRDSYNSGVSYGRVNIDSILRTATFESDKIIFERDDGPVESFVIGRYHLYKALVYNKTVAGFNILLDRIYTSLVEEGFVADPTGLLSEEALIAGYVDDAILEASRKYAVSGKNPEVRKMATMFLSRRPLELAYAEPETLEAKKLKKQKSYVESLIDDQEARRELAKKAGIEEEWILPARMKPLEFIKEEEEIYIRKGGLVPVSKGGSPMMKMVLGKVLRSSRIYTKKGYGKRVRDAL